MAMNQARVGLLVAAALLTMPFTASAQPKGPKGAAAAQPKGGAAAGGRQKEINLDEPAAGDKPAGAAGPDQPVATPEGETPGGDTGLGDICKIDPSACPTIDMEKAAKRDLKAQM